MKPLIKNLIREYFDYYDDSDMDVYDIPEENENTIKLMLKKLPDVITLYRILVVDSPELINKNRLGSHYSMDKKNLLKTHSFIKGKTYYLVTVKANKTLIDFKTTINNQLMFPNEKEITLKNKGKDVNIVSIDKI